MTPYNYESFNARNLTPEEVAGTFIASKDYWDIWGNNHTVVLGPRGSGKTTLFKMLTVQALYWWENESAKPLRESRPFTAIYVPTDMHWHHQLKYSEERLAEAPELREAVSRCAITTSVLLATVKTFQARMTYEAPGRYNDETVVAKALIGEWKLANSLPSFEMIVLALKSRISEIRALVNGFARRRDASKILANLPSYFDLEYFPAMDLACATFDTVLKLPQSKKWAVCFDEMELAPDWFQALTLSEIRSSEQEYLIKISTSPIPAVSGTTGAQPKQDYHLISIWNHSGRGGDEFSLQLSENVLQRRLGHAVNAVKLLGNSELVSSNEDPAKYERESAEWHLFRDLASWDDSFRALLIEHNIDPEDPVAADINLRDSVLRKAKPIAKFRSAFLKKVGPDKLWFRSRKVAGVYCGIEAILRVSDGNPRRLIGIINDLAARVRFDSSGNPLPLSENEQDDVLRDASAQFLGYVHALPGGVAILGAEKLDLSTILKAIASYFRQSLLGNTFQLDPKGSFIVDSRLNRQVVELIRLGVYHGAIVHIDPVPGTVETTVVGKRFRLSYMLAPTSRLPLNLYGEISLTTILKSSPRLRIKRAVRSLEQPELLI